MAKIVLFGLHARVFEQKWFHLDKVLCFAQMVVFGPKRLYLENLISFGQNWLYLNKSGSNFRVKCCVLPKW